MALFGTQDDEQKEDCYPGPFLFYNDDCDCFGMFWLTVVLDYCNQARFEKRQLKRKTKKACPDNRVFARHVPNFP